MALKNSKKADTRIDGCNQNKKEPNRTSSCTKISDIVAAAAATTSSVTAMALSKAMNNPQNKPQREKQQPKEEIVLSCEKLMKTNRSHSIATSDMTKQINQAFGIANKAIGKVKSGNIDKDESKSSRKSSDLDFVKKDSKQRKDIKQPTHIANQTKTEPKNIRNKGKEITKNQQKSQIAENATIKKDATIPKRNSCQIDETIQEKYAKHSRSASDFGISKKDAHVLKSFGKINESSIEKICNENKEDLMKGKISTDKMMDLKKNPKEEEKSNSSNLKSLSSSKDTENNDVADLNLCSSLARSIELKSNQQEIQKSKKVTRKGSIFVDATVETNFPSEEGKTITSFAGCQRLEGFEGADEFDTEAHEEEEDILADEAVITVKRPPSYSLPIIHPVSEVYKVGVYRKSFDSAAANILSRSNLESKLMRSAGTSTSSVCSTQTPSKFLESRPPQNIFFNPYGSPRNNRRRIPLRESRRISIEQSGSFIQLNQFKQSEQIGQGSYGLVKLAFDGDHSTGEEYAMKILSKRRLLRKAGIIGRGSKKTFSPLERVYNEIAVLKKLDHPNVVKVVDIISDSLEDSLYLLFEYLKQGGVLNVPSDKALSEERAWSVFRDAVQGLEYLHHQRIIHADIKPSNLLVSESGHVKLGDLGLCSEFIGDELPSSDSESRISGTAFRAPETLFQTQQFLTLGKASDIWSLGATLYALIFGYAPFMSSTVAALYDKVKNESLVFPDAPAIGSELRDLIKRMLVKDPAKRITLPKIKEHPWVTSRWVSPLPSEEENCSLVHVTEEDLNSAVRSIPRVDTFIMIKTTLKGETTTSSSSSSGVSGRAPQRGGSRMERFLRAGRSNSAPGSYPLPFDMQIPNENTLPSLMEFGSSGSTESKNGSQNNK